jgi:hypothetical protein
MASCRGNCVVPLLLSDDPALADLALWLSDLTLLIPLPTIFVQSPAIKKSKAISTDKQNKMYLERDAK